MGNIKIIKGVFDTKLELEHAGIAAGFPSPADEYRHETLDFNRDYIRHPEASFYGDVDGDSMRDAGLLDGDRVIIDRAVEPHDGSIVVAWWDGGFTMKFLDLTHRKDGYIELRLVTPTSSTIPIVQAAHDVLDRIFIQGYQYKKAGVIVMGISPDSPIQQDLFDLNAEQIQKMRRLDEVIDRINRMHGSETIVIGAQQYTQKNGKGKAEVFANAIKHDFKSKNPTTRWSDVIKLK